MNGWMQVLLAIRDIYAQKAYSSSLSGTSDFVTVTHDCRVGVGTDSPTSERHLDVRGNAVFGT